MIPIPVLDMTEGLLGKKRIIYVSISTTMCLFEQCSWKGTFKFIIKMITMPHKINAEIKPMAVAMHSAYHWIISREFMIYGLNTMRPWPNGNHFWNIFKGIFIEWNIWIFISISLKCVPRGPYNNISALVQIMARRRPGDNPLSVPDMRHSASMN